MKKTPIAKSRAKKIPSKDGMFSAASFAGVVSDYTSERWDEPNNTPTPMPPVVAFYGFRGGAGRTTALAHVAAQLAYRQVSIVAIDLDLEAPGLHHVLACPLPDNDRGILALLRRAATAPQDTMEEALRLAPHVLKSGLEMGTPIRVLPAGRLTEKYLQELEDLGVPLWHVTDEPSPLEVVVKRVKEELQPQVILLDCRTGLSGISASALFHLADVVVCFLPVSGQSVEGLDVFLKAAKSAKMKRSGRPDLLIVPSMVPDSIEGRERLADWFVPLVEEHYLDLVLGVTDREEREQLSDQVPLVREGVVYRAGIALSDSLRPDFAQLSAGVYQALMGRLESGLGLDQGRKPVSIDAKRVLAELKQHGNLKSLPFAEEDPKATIQKFTRPHEFKALIDRATWYVKGAKGAGKTALWLYLQSPSAADVTPGMTFLAAHGPGEELLTSSAFRELERDKSLRMMQNRTHGALWLFCSCWRIANRFRAVATAALSRFHGDERRLLQGLVSASAEGLQPELRRVLAFERTSSLAEQFIRALDSELLASGSPAVTLLFDGLDIGFGSDEKSLQTRAHFVSAIVEAIEPLRGSCKRIFFKLFIREDVFAELSLQNQSHLEAATVELQWEPRDMWILALNLLSASPHYLEAVHAIDSSASPNSWPQEDERRQRLLVPLWGAQMERGNKVSTTNFVERRTADGKGRLFPRTLVQLLDAAVDHQRTIEPFPDRVLRSASIIAGYNKASSMRVEDLRKEYAALSEYLGALKGMDPTGTETEIRDHLKRKILRKKKGRGAEAGSLHAGAGGWRKVIERLLEIGVFREYKRARGAGGEQKYEIALLYRPGLGIKAYGV